VLVDYDNIQEEDKRKGLIYIASIVKEKLAHAIQDDDALKEIQLRLYGGWYDKMAVTRRAQDLSIEIGRNFPFVFDGKFKVHIELARSLAKVPKTVLYHTFRTQRPLENIKCKNPETNCTSGDCPLWAMYDFISNRRCPVEECTKTPEEVFYKDEQKLVDVMLAIDLMHFATTERKTICLVTSDDDFIPAIHATISEGIKVIHLQTKNRCTSKLETSQKSKYLSIPQ